MYKPKANHAYRCELQVDEEQRMKIMIAVPAYGDCLSCPVVQNVF